MNKVIFLDRDGTLNVDPGKPVFLREDWEWERGAIDALKQLQGAGFVLAVVTNQTGIGHDMYKEEQMLQLHSFMENELRNEGIRLAAIAYCPHHREEGCNCRKPHPGMARQVEEKIGEIDYANSWMAGDKFADVKFGKNIGTKTALIRSQYWKEEDVKLQPDIVVDSLFEAAQHITNA